MTLRDSHALYRQAMFGWCNFALAVPAVYLWLGLPLLMREHGWSGTDIGLYMLTGMPAVLKFALAAPVERRRHGAPRYKVWVLALNAGVILILGWLAWQGQTLLEQRGYLYGLALTAGLLLTWADIPLNALAIRLIPVHQRLLAGSIRSGAMSLGAITGGGLMLLVQSRWGWQAPFMLMMVALGSAIALLLPALQGRQEPAPPQGTIKNIWLGYFGQDGSGLWNCLLLLFFPCLAAAWLYLKPLLLDHGFSVEQAAWIAGVGGGTVAAIASLLCGRLAAHLGIVRTVQRVALLGLLALLTLTAAVAIPAAGMLTLPGVVLLSAAMGMAAALTFGLMMHFSRARARATDYGIQASLFALGRLLVATAAGMLLDLWGYPGLLSVLMLAMLAVTLLCRYGAHAWKHALC
ncbi:MFS transporter [Zobellella sp. DQSA1]|uniref:MFS transporter n=1 Tax=Zobellella sp. DQSA1 TaxID=3342386 RepID=UPI0035C0384D